MAHHSPHSDEYLWCLILRGKQKNKTHTNTKFFPNFQRVGTLTSQNYIPTILCEKKTALDLEYTTAESTTAASTTGEVTPTTAGNI